MDFLFGDEDKITRPLLQSQQQINRIIGEARDEARRGELIRGGGLTSSRGTGANAPLTVNASPFRRALVGRLTDSLRGQSRETGRLRAQVAPGFGELTRRTRDVFGAERDRAIGNLRETFGRRRVLGSSFAADTEARARSEFAQRENLAVADAFVNELSMSASLLDQEFKAEQASFQTELAQMDLEANVALSLAGKASDAFTNLANIQSQALASIGADTTSALGALAAGRGAFIGQLISGGSRIAAASAGGGGTPT